MKARSLAAVSLVVTGLLVLLLLPTSPFTDDTAFLSTFYRTEPPTVSIQQCDAFLQTGNGPAPVLYRAPLTGIRVEQSRKTPLNTIALRDLWLVARLYPVYRAGVAASWLFML